MSQFGLFSQQNNRMNPYLIKPTKPTLYNLSNSGNTEKKMNTNISLKFSNRMSLDNQFLLPNLNTAKTSL